MRNRPLGQSLAHGRHHADIFQHHRGRFARRARRYDHQRIVGAQQLRKFRAGFIVEQIEFFPPKPKRSLACAAELAQDRAADKSPGAENNRALGAGLKRCCYDAASDSDQAAGASGGMPSV